MDFSSNAKINYNSLINLTPEIKNTRGEDVIVAVLDTGCHPTHRDIKPNILATYDALTGSNVILDRSTKGHGTFICGLIAVNTPADGIIGTAPEAKIIPVRIIENTSVTGANVVKGLKWLLDSCPVRPDIINLSVDFVPGTFKDEIEGLLKQASDNNIMIVAAGMDYNQPTTPGIYYPASGPVPTAIAVLDSQILQEPGFSGLNPKIKYLLPKFKYLSACNSNFLPYIEQEGSSFATAIISGVLALAISYKKKYKIELPVIQFLDQQIPTFDSQEFSNTFKIWKQ